MTIRLVVDNTKPATGLDLPSLELLTDAQLLDILTQLNELEARILLFERQCLDCVHTIEEFCKWEEEQCREK